MRLDLIVEAITDGYYVLGAASDVEGNYPCTVPTVHLGPKLVPIGTQVTLYFATPVDPEVIRSNGRHYGYPECCIEDFATRLERGSAEQRAAAQKTGFMPCPACTKLVLAGKPLHELILPSRQAKKPFRYPLGVAPDDPNPGC